MANINEIRIEDFSAGLITDYSSTDQPEVSGTTVENCDLTSVGKLKKSRGTKSFGSPTIPTGMTVEAFYEFHITIPESKDITVIFGSVSSRDRFYISPWYDDSDQTWNTTTWLELTEAVLTTIATKASNTDYTLTATTGISSTDDYHNKWYVGIFSSADSFRGNDYVLDYTGSTRRLQTKYGVAGTVVGDKVLLMRFPVFKNVSSALTPHYQIDSLPTFTQHGEHLYIYTGSHALDSGTDLWLGFIGTSSARQGYLNDNDLDFRGLHFESSVVFRPNDSGFITSATPAAETENPLPWTASTDRWFFKTTFLLDGFQETVLFYTDQMPFFQTYDLGAANKKFTIALSLSFKTAYPRSDFWLYSYLLSVSLATGLCPILSRRVQRVLFYAARGQAGTPDNRPTTPFFMWKDISIDDSNWTLAAGVYDYTGISFTGIEWDFAQKFPYEVNTGHSLEVLGANAKQGLQAGGFYVTGPIYADQEYKDTFVIAPLSGTLVGKNTMPNVIPLSLWVRCREQGIYEIITMAELAGRLLVFGANTMAVVELVESTILTGRIVEQFQKRGIISDRGVQVIDGRAYYCGRESIYAFDGSQVVDIGDRIKSDWNSISLANRQACFTGFNRRLKQFFIKAGSTLFVYSTQQNNWKTETLDKTWTFFGVGVDGEFLGTDGTDIFQLDATGYTVSRALHWKSKHFDSNRIKPRRFRASYKGSDLITARIYDEEKSSSVPVETILLLPETIEKHVNIPVSFESTRISIDLQSASSTNDDTEIDYISLAETAKTQR